MNPDDERCQTGAMIRAASSRFYRVIRTEDSTQENFGRLGGTVGGGLFVQMEGEIDQRCPTCRMIKGARWTRASDPHGLGHVSWMSPESVLAAKLEIPAPAGMPDALDQAA